MASLTLSFLNANRRPLGDQVDVEVSLVRTNDVVARVLNSKGSRKVSVRDLTPRETYLVRVFPMRYRPVGRFVLAPSGDRPEQVELYCPVHPQRVREVGFPAYDDLDSVLRGVVERSALERDAGLPPLPPATDKSAGEILWESLTRVERAGLLNIFCKMNNTPLGDATTWAYVTDVYRVRGDRLFANVQLEFRDRVKNAQAGGGFTEVEGALHTPPPGFSQAGSFKTRDRYGNLQLTFFSSNQGPLQFRVDADIDDAAGIAHAFQVLEHWITGGETHPFDIHQILTFYQRLDVKYELVV